MTVDECIFHVGTLFGIVLCLATQRILPWAERAGKYISRRYILKEKP